jgi:hypothetical protein
VTYKYAPANALIPMISIDSNPAARLILPRPFAAEAADGRVPALRIGTETLPAAAAVSFGLEISRSVGVLKAARGCDDAPLDGGSKMRANSSID